MSNHKAGHEMPVGSVRTPGFSALATWGTLAVFTFSLLDLPWVEAAQWALGIVLITFFAAIPRMSSPVRRDPAWWFLYGGIGLACLTYLNSNLQFPEYAEPYPQLDVLGSLFLFFPVAWWLRGNTRNVLTVYALALLGFALALFRFGTVDELIQAFDGVRVDFGFRNWQHVAVFFGSALVGWIVFAKRIVLREQRQATVLRAAAWTIVFVVLVAGCVVTQTRAVWLGLIAAAITVLGMHLALHKRLFTIRNGMAALAVVAVTVTAVLVSGAGQIISDRVADERTVVNRIFAGEIEDLPYTSIGTRIHLWAEAWRWIEQRPITGWGYTAKKRVIDDSPRFSPEFKKTFGHLHSSVLGMWVTFGLLGLALLAWLAFWIGLTSWRSWREGRMPYDVFLFGVGFFPFWLVVNQFETYLIWGTGVYLMALVVGTLYSYHLAGRRTLPESGAPGA